MLSPMTMTLLLLNGQKVANPTPAAITAALAELAAADELEPEKQGPVSLSGEGRGIGALHLPGSEFLLTCSVAPGPPLCTTENLIDLQDVTTAFLDLAQGSLDWQTWFAWEPLYP
jgi:hypothetical protein